MNDDGIITQTYPRYCHANPGLHHHPHDPQETLTSLSLESLRRELLPILAGHDPETSDAVTITGHRLLRGLSGSLDNHLLSQGNG